MTARAASFAPAASAACGGPGQALRKPAANASPAPVVSITSSSGSARSADGLDPVGPRRRRLRSLRDHQLRHVDLRAEHGRLVLVGQQQVDRLDPVEEDGVVGQRRGARGIDADLHARVAGALDRGERARRGSRDAGARSRRRAGRRPSKSGSSSAVSASLAPGSGSIVRSPPGATSTTQVPVGRSASRVDAQLDAVEPCERDLRRRVGPDAADQRRPARRRAPASAATLPPEPPGRMLMRAGVSLPCAIGPSCATTTSTFRSPSTTRSQRARDLGGERGVAQHEPDVRAQALAVRLACGSARAGTASRPCRRCPRSAAARSPSLTVRSCSSGSSCSSSGLATTTAPGAPVSLRARITAAASSGESTRHGTGSPEASGRTPGTCPSGSRARSRSASRAAPACAGMSRIDFTPAQTTQIVQPRERAEVGRLVERARARRGARRRARRWRTRGFPRARPGARSRRPSSRRRRRARPTGARSRTPHFASLAGRERIERRVVEARRGPRPPRIAIVAGTAPCSRTDRLDLAARPAGCRAAATRGR